MYHSRIGFLLFIAFLSSTACMHRRKNPIIPGDIQAAERLFNDTLSARIYIQQEDSSFVRVTGQHWFANEQNDTSLHVTLDRRNFPVKGIKTEQDGSFSFRLPHFSQIMHHTIRVTQYNSKGEKKEAGAQFSILPSEN